MPPRANIEASASIVAGVIAIGGAYQTFLDYSLQGRLIVIAVAALLICFGLNPFLSRWIKPPTKTNSPPARFSKKKFLIFVALQLIICICIVLFASWFVIGQLTFQFDEAKSDHKVMALLVAPYPGVKRVVVNLPSFNEGKCISSDRTPSNSIPGATMVQLDWNTTTPALSLIDFAYPQRVEIVCQGDRAIRHLSVTPQSTAVYVPQQLWWWRFWSVLTGGVLWLAASGFLWFSSRKRSG